MVRRVRTCRTRLVLTALVLLGSAGPRSAKSAEPSDGVDPAAAPSNTVAETETGVGGAGAAAPESAEVPMVDAASQVAAPAYFGVGARLRLTSVPRWMLGLFLDEGVPLTSYTAGFELFRRSGNFDFVLGLAYQSLSPNAGNWLGKDSDPRSETDYVQFDGLASWSFDAAFIVHSRFTEYVGMHYGGGVGIGIVSGRMLRTSNGSPGCATDPGDPTRCFPQGATIDCPAGPCTEAQLRASEGRIDGPTTPSRYSDTHVPSVYPIVNLVTGIDIYLPDVRGLAMKLEIGYFFPYFFFGPSVAYQI